MFDALRQILRPVTALPTAAQGLTLRRFEGVATGRRGRQVTPMPALNPAILASRGRLASVARGLAANNALAASGVTAWAANLIGDGIKPQSAHPDPSVRQAINAAWDRWTDNADEDGLLDFYGLQDVAARRMVTDGEGFGTMLVDEAGRLTVRLLDADQVSPELARELGNNWRVVAGVEFDGAGRRVAYHVLRDRPGLPLSPLVNAFGAVRIPAEDMLHLFRVETPGQVRGLSWFAPVILRLAGLDTAHDAQLLRQQIAAMLCGFVVEPNADRQAFGEGEPDGLGGLDGGLEPGTMKVLDPGQDVRFSDPAELGAEAIDFLRITAREIAVGLGVPAELLTGDLSQVNYSSARIGLVEFRRRCEAISHSVIVFQFCRRVWRRFVFLEIASGRLDAPAFLDDPELYLSARWMPPRFGWLDPLDDVQAEVTAINAGLMSRRQAVAARGYDLEVIDREIAEDRDRARALGLDFGAGALPNVVRRPAA
ncbi:phage portal protein [Methylobacterium sp. A54F]